MRLNAYTIFDSASGAYMRPFFLLADSQALRSFKDIAADSEHEVGKHPEDYSLIRCGTFDDQTGKFHPEDVFVLATGIEVVAQGRNIDRAQLDAFEKEALAAREDESAAAARNGERT